MKSDFSVNKDDICIDGHGHVWKENNIIVKDNKVYQYLVCKKCERISEAWWYERRKFKREYNIPYETE